MDRRRLHVIKWIVALLLLLFFLLLSDVKAQEDDVESVRRRSKTRNENNINLDNIPPEVEGSQFESSSELLDETEPLELLKHVSSIGGSSPSVSSDDDDDELSQFADELLVEDDDHVDLESVNYLGAEDYEESYKFSGPEYEELPHCTQEKNDVNRPAVVVSTLDGRVTSLDAQTGAVLWSQRTGGRNKEMLSSSMSKLEVTSRGDWVRLIPSLDGGIYRCDGDVVEALPVTAESLLHSSFKFNSDTIFTGGRATEVWGMSLDTGKPVYMCNSSGCKRQKTASKPSPLLVVKRITQTVRAVDPKSGDERWNFSVGQHEVNVAGGGCDSMDTSDFDVDGLPSLHFIVPEGVVMGMDNDGHLVWQQKLASPVVNAWKVFSGELEQIDLFSTSSVPALTPDNSIPEGNYRAQGRDEKQQPALYVGVHEKQLYIQQSGVMRLKVNSAHRIFTSVMSEEEGGSHEVAFPRVQWRPYLATALSRTPVVNINNKNQPLISGIDAHEEVTAVAVPQQIEYPYASQCMAATLLLLDETLGLGSRDNGYYLFADESNGQLNFSGPWEVPVMEEENLMDDVASQIVRICFQIGPDTWVKVACAVVFYTALHYFVIRWFVMQMRQRMADQAVNFISMMLHHIIMNNPHIISLIQRMGVQLPQLPAPPPQEQDNNPPLASNISEDSKIESSSPFISRYVTDFKPVQCLGRGGFGVVFQVYNKLDENEYAVKRITLPSKESSAERVKREVRALAKLNHTNIVRYYNSWLETPPLGWQEESEMSWICSDALSNTVFTREEETQDMQEKSEVKKSLVKGSLGPLDDVLKRLNPNQVFEYSSKCSNESETNISDEYVDDTKDDNDDLESSSEYSKQFFAPKREDTSVDIVFENSESTNNLGKEDSFEVLFEHSENKAVCDKSGDSFSDEEYLGVLRKRQGCSQSDDSLSIAFTENTEENVDKLNVRNTKNNSSSVYSSQFDNNKNHSNLDFSSDSNIKKRRIQSQPAQQNNVAEGDRPRTLSLGTTVEDTASKIRQEYQLRPKTFLYIQMELCQKESLKDWLLKNSQVRKENIVFSLFNDIIRAVEYVHDNQLMHRDLKPSNIFFSLDGEIKIGDFGLVTNIAEGEQEIRTPATVNPLLQASDRHTHRVGTQLYMSPEQVSHQVYDYKVDIYSLGLIFFEMLVPFSTGMERLMVMSNLREGRFPDGFCDKYPDETDLLKLMLSTNPANRPTTRGIRARKPLRPLQGSSVDDISPEDHFRLIRQRSHIRSHSGSSFSFTSSTSST